MKRRLHCHTAEVKQSLGNEFWRGFSEGHLAWVCVQAFRAVGLGSET